MTFFKIAVRQLFWVLALVAFLPLWNAGERIQEWLVDQFPSFDWIMLGADSIPWRTLPLYLLLVAVAAVMGVLCNAIVLHSWGSHRRADAVQNNKSNKKRSWLRLVVGALSGVAALMVAAYPILFSSQTTALAMGGSVASAILLLCTFLMVALSGPEPFSRNRIAVLQGVSIGAGLVGGWAAGLIWALTF